MLCGHFIPCAEGRVYITQFGSLSTTAILCLPSIFEEMNLSRAVVAKQAQYFSSTGLPCVVMDYLGTGDSEKEFEQVGVSDWIDNIITVADWMRGLGVKHIILWGVRFGGLLMLANQQRLHDAIAVKRQLVWKPPVKGKSFMSQLIRMKQMSQMMSGDDKKVNWREEILAGKFVEIGGYQITHRHLNDIESLDVSAPPLSPVGWVEYAVKKLTPAITKVTEDWPQEMIKIEVADCTAFWQVPEIFELSEFHALNSRLLEDGTWKEQ